MRERIIIFIVSGTNEKMADKALILTVIFKILEIIEFFYAKCSIMII